MGEIADLMINGDICEGCGIELQGVGLGYPRRCASCGGNTPEMEWDEDDEVDDEDEKTKTPRPGEP